MKTLTTSLLELKLKLTILSCLEANKRHLNQTATLAQSKYWEKKKTSMLIKVLLSSEIELGWFLFCLCMKLKKNTNTTFIKYDHLILNILLTIFLACSSQSGVWCVMSNTGIEHC